MRRMRRCVVLLVLLTACSSPPASPAPDLAVDAPTPAPDLAVDARGADRAAADRPRGEPLAADLGAPDAAWPAGFVPAPRNVPSGHLCTIPADYVSKGGDPVHPPCDVEADTFSDLTPSQIPNPLALKVVSWNVEWGRHAAAVESAFVSVPDLIDADVIFLQEVPRDDQESDPPGINLARQLAQVKKLNYVFAVEWDRRLKADQGGEHGVVVLARYPIGNVTQLRHTPLHDFYAEKQDFGGRMTLGVDLAIGARRVRLYSAHLCTRDYSGAGRAKQGAEILADAALPGQPAAQVLGGDLNTFLCNPLVATCNLPPDAEQVVQDLLAAGWTDLLPGFTSWTQLGVGLLPQRLDWLFGQAVVPKTHAVLQKIKAADHAPVVARVKVP